MTTDTTDTTDTTADPSGTPGRPDAAPTMNGDPTTVALAAGDLCRHVADTFDRIEAGDRPEVWITLVPRGQALREAETIEARRDAGVDLPLAGLTVAVKDNIDVAGLPTTAGCPAYASVPERSAPAVQALVDAGAIVIGKTNLDQFATGLVGTRSPHGVVANAHDPERIAGGSSSGSAVAVALGYADLALGTDTAGSGRVPAAFNGIVGIKPTIGMVSSRGVVPACASFDCVSIFARTVGTAVRAADLVATFDPDDPRARRPGVVAPCSGAPVIGVPGDEHLQLAPDARRRFDAAADRVAELGATVVEIDFAPFVEAAALLYGGSFVAERYAAVGPFIEANLDAVDPTVASIILASRDLPAHELAADLDQLRTLRRRAETTFATVDAVLVPTAPFLPTIAEVAADPVGVNTRLGRFANSCNLLDLCAVALPAGTTDDGLPFGVSLYAPAFHDRRIASVAAAMLGEPPLAAAGSEDISSASGASGASGSTLAEVVTIGGSDEFVLPAADADEATIMLVVAGAHLTGQPLNHQLTDRGAHLVARTTTAVGYRLYALDTDPPKPGLVRSEHGGKPIEVEVWALAPAAFASFVAAIPAPLAIGAVELADGTWEPGFTCMPHGLDDAREITEWGGWRAFLAAG